MTAARLYAAVALATGALIVFLTPPFQAPDEPAHWERAVQVGEGHVGGEPGGGELPVAVADTFEQFSRLHDGRARTSAGEVRQWAFAIRLRGEPRRYARFANTVVYPPVAYVPAAVVAAVAEAVHAPLGVAFAGARLATLFAAVALIAASLSVAAPEVTWPLALLALLPMSQALIASVSADALILAFAIANAALSTAERQRPLALAATGAALVAIKPVYAPLLLATSLAGSRGRARWLTLALPLALAAAWWLWARRNYQPLVDDFSPAAQLAWASAHPLEAAGRIARAVFDWRHLDSFVGVLGWLDRPVPRWTRIALLLSLVAVPLTSRRSNGWAWPGVAASAALIGASMLLTATPVGAQAVAGVQGRYFLPLYAVAALSSPRWLRVDPRPLTIAAALLSSAATLFTLANGYWS